MVIQKMPCPAASPPASEDEVRRMAFSKKLSGERDASAKAASGFLFQILRLIKAHPSFQMKREELLRESVPLCFANFEGQKKEEFESMRGRLVDSALKIAYGPKGEEFFEWALRRALKIAKKEEESKGPKEVLLLFEACAVAASFGKEFEVDQFIHSYKSIEKPKRQVFLESITASTDYASLHLVLGTANQKLFSEFTDETF